MDHDVPTLPRAAISHEDMWYELKTLIAEMVMARRAPEQVFHIREAMAEMEQERTKPWRLYIKEHHAELIRQRCADELEVKARR